MIREFLRKLLKHDKLNDQEYLTYVHADMTETAIDLDRRRKKDYIR